MKSQFHTLSETTKEKDIMKTLNNNYSILALDWFDIQFTWLTEAYKYFKDHDKYLILVFIVKKTFDHYSKNYVNFTIQEFYNLEKIEIEKFNIIEISKALNISRETTRRKVYELENKGIIKTNKKNILVEKNAFDLQKPTMIINRVASFLNKLSKICVDNNILKYEITKDQLNKTAEKRFSHIWKLWYDMLIPNMVEHKNLHKDLETFHIWGSVVMNQTYETNKYLSKNKITISNKSEYIKLLTNIDEVTGINAMSISSLTGIPRATVIRKLQSLINNKIVFIDKKKLYHLNYIELKKVSEQHNAVINRLSTFITQIFNLAKFS